VTANRLADLEAEIKRLQAALLLDGQRKADLTAERALADELALAAIAYRDELFESWDRLDAALIAWEARRG